MISPYIWPEHPRWAIKMADRCKEWEGTYDAQGYPRYKSGGRSLYVHRAEFEYFHRRLEPGEKVYRACGNRRCVNALHLVTEKPVTKKRRQRPASAKLNPRKVREIREALARRDRPSQRALAEKYGVTPAAISHVARRKTWAHV